MVLDTVGMSERLERAEKTQRNRGLLLEAARRVFLDHGYAGATLALIVDAAGFSKGVVYSQFESKADLLLALLEERIALRADQNERIASRHAGEEGVAALIRNFLKDAEAEAGWARLLVEFRVHAARDPAINRRYAELHAHSVTRLANVLVGLHERAGVALAHPARAMAELVLAIGAGVTLERAANPQAVPPRALIPMMLAAIGLGAARGSP